MKINTNEHVAAIRDGVPIIAITTRALARLNPEVFKKARRRDGFDWGKIGLKPFSGKDNGKAVYLAIDEVVKVFDKLEEGFVMPTSRDHLGYGKNTQSAQSVALLCEIRDLLCELLNVWKSDSKSVPEHGKLD